MLPFIPKPAVSVRQKVAALWVASIVDFIQMPGFMIFGEGIASPLEDILDFLTAVILVAICGFRWQFMFAFAMELVPGLSLFPTWTMVVLTMPTNLSAGEEEMGQRVMVRRVDDDEFDVEAEQAGESAGGEVDVDGVVVPPVQAPRIQSGAEL